MLTAPNLILYQTYKTIILVDQQNVYVMALSSDVNIIEYPGIYIGMCNV